ncbi:MAG: TIR domain-containing protein, partial [Aquificales bacterium]|nr:TIR domain-containing protein [Aquificales bacterium]
MNDLFISCVAADQPTTDALTNKLQQDGLTLTLIRLGLGDSLAYRMEQGFREANYGVLILSPDFFKKPWPRSELDKIAMIDREFDDQSRLFPLWQQITQAEIARYSSALA